MATSDLNVLIADDSSVVLKIATKILNDCGVTEVDAVMDGEAVLKRVKSNRPDLILLDLNMPRMDGVEVLTQASPDYFPPIILCSTAGESTLKSAREIAVLKGLRIIGILQKPYSAGSLKALLDRVTGGQGDADRKMAISNKMEIDHILANIAESLVLYFQPQMTFEDTLYGAEVLARWRGPDGTILSPATFVPVLEQHGKTAILTSLVIERSLETAARWKAEGMMVPLAVNVSATDFEQHEFVNNLSAMAGRYGIEPEQITLELTETKISAKLADMLTALTRLRMKGFALSVDDFGCGASTLQQLRQAPFSELKIDGQFVNNLSNDEQNSVIVETCVGLAKRLGLKVVAECVETQEDYEVLKRLKCTAFQGHLLSRPLSEDAFLDWFIGWQSSLRTHSDVRLSARK